MQRSRFTIRLVQSRSTRFVVSLASLALGFSLVQVVGAPATGAWQVGPVATETAAVVAVTERPDRVSAAEAASAQGSRVEIGSERTEYATSWANPDGTFTYDYSIRPVRAMTESGWRAPDPTLRVREDGALVPAVTTAAMVFSGGGDRRLATISRDGKELSLSVRWTLPAPTVDGATATYRDVPIAGVDLVATAEPEGFSQVFRVNTRVAASDPALRELAFDVETLGVTVRGMGGGFAAVDGDGAAVFTSPTPFMWDSSASAVDPIARRLGEVMATVSSERRVRQPVDGDRVARMPVEVSGGAVTVTPDAGLLADADATLPIYIDPTVSATRSEWTVIQSGFGGDDADYWNYTGDAGVGLCAPSTVPACIENDVKRIIWEFALPAQIAGTHITSATFKAWGTHSLECLDWGIRLYRVPEISPTTVWNNHAHLWSTMLDEVFVHHKNAAGCDPPRWISFNAAAGVQTAADGAWPRLALGLRTTSETCMHCSWKRYRYDTSLSITYGTSAVTSPAEGDRTQAAVRLTAISPQPEVTYQSRPGVASSLPWTTIPTSKVFPSGSGTPISTWPQATTAQLDWNVANTVASDGAVQVRGCFTPGTPGTYCSQPVTITLDRTAFGDSYATEQVGPGVVASLTGDYSVGVTDISFGELAVGRTHTTLAPAPSGVLGPGWVASIPGPEYTGRAAFKLEDHSASGYVLLVGEDGQTLTYLEEASGTYIGIGDAADGSVITKESATQFTVKDPDGTTTRWVLSGSGWAVSEVVSAPAEGTTSFVRDGSGRVTTVIAPAPSGVTCTPGALVAGCRAITIDYASTTTATGTAEAEWGDFVGQIKTVDYTAYDPDLSGMRTVTVSGYLYDSTGHLRAAWDPRISPALKTRYSYNAAGRLATLTPPGLNGWTLAYDTLGRLAHATRTDPVHGVATQAVAYAIPISGTGAPIDLSGATTATWAQTTDLPRVGTAVFPASHVPPRDGSTGAYQPVSTDWKYADLTYLDVNGRPVNAASFGAGAWQIDATRWDAFGNEVWQLTVGNRAQSLAPTGATDPYVAARPTTAERADLLATINTYTSDGADPLTSTGPTHPVMLHSGVVASARTRTTHVYDEGKPDSQVYHLVTTTTVEPVVVDGSATPTADDQRVSVNSYDPVDGAPATGPTSGWTLRKPTVVKTVLVAPAPSIEHKTIYDAAGRTIESRQPASNGSDAGTTTYRHYAAAADIVEPACGMRPEWAGLLCRVAPKAQPTGPEIPARFTTYTYERLADVVTEMRASGAVVRTTDMDYDSAVRPTQVVGATTGEAPSTPVPATSFGYDPDTGFQTTTSDGTRTLTTGYDSIGRVVSYTDADGNTSTSTYTIDGQLATHDDGKGTYTYTYDGTDALGRDERRGLPTSIDTGMGSAPDVFTAAYDADGELVRQDYPNGLTATYEHNNASEATRLTYTKDSNTWLDYTATPSAHGQTGRIVGTGGSTQVYTYDRAGRLVRTDDTYQGHCTVRTYTLDPNSNRTRLDTYPDAGDGACTTSTTPTTQTHTHDTADRIRDTGYSYDQLGRTLTVPADHTTGGGALTATYYANDLPHTLSGGGVTQTFTFDPTGRYRTATRDSGPQAGTVVNHYDCASDSPAWIAEHDGTWTRNVSGVTGDLAAIQYSDSTVYLQITNLHGDVVAVVLNDPAATGVSAHFEQTEYGVPRADNPTNPDRYGWLGGKQRSADVQAGLILMGVRLYNPETGLFLTVDPVPGGNATAYTYPADPVNMFDLDGRHCSWRHPHHCVRDAWRKITRSKARKIASCTATCTAARCGTKVAGCFRGPWPIQWKVACAAVRCGRPAWDCLKYCTRKYG